MTNSNNAINSTRPFRPNNKQAEARWASVVDQNWDRDREIGVLTQDLYYDLKCGYGAAEYNLANAGMIEMIFGHTAGKYHEGDNAWTDGRWTVTQQGGQASMAELERIIVQDPPLGIALADMELEAEDVADNCGGCQPGDELLLEHKRILDHLRMRAERIAATEKSGER